MFDESDIMETNPSYEKGDIVWVKLSGCWWPGEVKHENDLPSDLLSDFKKPPLVIVKFFDEDSYEYIKQWSHIHPYNCDKKNDFIKKGMAGFRAKASHMMKFPRDIGIAEEKTNGNPNILSQPEFLPPKKINYDEIFDTTSPKKSSSSKKSVSKDALEPLITHRRFIGNDDYQAFIIPQYRGKDRELNSDDEDNEKLEQPTEDYTCHVCAFQTKRLGVLLIHSKFHDKGTHVTTKRKSKKIKDAELSDSDTEAPVAKAVKTKTPKPPRKKKEETQSKPVDVFANLLEEWDDSEDETATEAKNKKNGETAADIDSIIESTENTELTSPKKDPSKTNSFLNNSDVSLPQKKDTQDDIKNCFDFDEEDEEGDILLPAVSGRKIPRVIPEKPRASISELLEMSQKEDEADSQMLSEADGDRNKTRQDKSAIDPETDLNKKEILQISQSFNRAPAVDETIDVAFKELMQETELPELDELTQTLKPEQNFHDARAIKFPDKGGTALKGATPKSSTSRKRFVTSFEDFEAGFRKIEDQIDKEVERIKTKKPSVEDGKITEEQTEQLLANLETIVDDPPNVENEVSVSTLTSTHDPEHAQKEDVDTTNKLEDTTQDETKTLVEDDKRKSRRRTKQFVIEEDSEEIIDLDQGKGELSEDAELIISHLHKEAKDIDAEIEALKKGLEIAEMVGVSADNVEKKSLEQLTKDLEGSTDESDFEVANKNLQDNANDSSKRITRHDKPSEIELPVTEKISSEEPTSRKTSRQERLSKRKSYRGKKDQQEDLSEVKLETSRSAHLQVTKEQSLDVAEPESVYSDNREDHGETRHLEGHCEDANKLTLPEEKPTRKTGRSKKHEEQKTATHEAVIPKSDALEKPASISRKDPRSEDEVLPALSPSIDTFKEINEAFSEIISAGNSTLTPEPACSTDEASVSKSEAIIVSEKPASKSRMDRRSTRNKNKNLPSISVSIDSSKDSSEAISRIPPEPAYTDEMIVSKSDASTPLEKFVWTSRTERRSTRSEDKVLPAIPASIDTDKGSNEDIFKIEKSTIPTELACSTNVAIVGNSEENPTSKSGMYKRSTRSEDKAMPTISASIDTGKESNESICEIVKAIATPEPAFTVETSVSKFYTNTSLEKPTSKSRKDTRSTRSKDKVVPAVSAPVDTDKEGNEAICEIGENKTTPEPAYTDDTIVSKSDASTDLEKHASRSLTNRRSARSEDKMPAISASIDTGKTRNKSISEIGKSIATSEPAYTDEMSVSKSYASTTLEKPASKSRKDRRSTRIKDKVVAAVSAPVDTGTESNEAISVIGETKTTPELAYIDDSIVSKSDTSTDLEKHASKSRTSRRSTRSEDKVLPATSASTEAGKESNETFSEIIKSTSPQPSYTDDASTTLEKPASKSWKDRRSTRSKDKIVPDTSSLADTSNAAISDIGKSKTTPELAYTDDTIVSKSDTSTDLEKHASKSRTNRRSTRSEDKVLPGISTLTETGKERKEATSEIGKSTTTPEPDETIVSIFDTSTTSEKPASKSRKDRRSTRSKDKVVPDTLAPVEADKESIEAISEIGKSKTTPEPAYTDGTIVSKSGASTDLEQHTSKSRTSRTSNRSEDKVLSAIAASTETGKESNESIAEIGKSITTPEPSYTDEMIVSKIDASTTLDKLASKSRKDRRSTRSKDNVVPDASAPVDADKESNEAISEIEKSKTTPELAYTDDTIVSKSDASTDLEKHTSKSRTNRRSNRSEDKVMPAIAVSTETGKESNEATSEIGKSTTTPEPDGTIVSKFDASTTSEKPASKSRKDRRSTRSKDKIVPGTLAPVEADKESIEAISEIGKSKTTPEPAYTDDTIVSKSGASTDLEQHTSKSRTNRRSNRSEDKVLPAIAVSTETGKDSNEATSEIGKSTTTPEPDGTIVSKFDASTTSEKPASKSRKDRRSTRSKDKVVPDTLAPVEADKESIEAISEIGKSKTTPEPAYTDDTIVSKSGASTDLEQHTSKSRTSRRSNRSEDKVLSAIAASTETGKESNEVISEIGKSKTTPEPAYTDDTIVSKSGVSADLEKHTSKSRTSRWSNRSEDKVLPAIAVSTETDQESNEATSEIGKSTTTPEPDGTIVSKFDASTTSEKPASKSRKDRRSTRSKDKIVPDTLAPVEADKESIEAISEIGKSKTTPELAYTDDIIVSKSGVSIDLEKHTSKSRTSRWSNRSEDKVLPAIVASTETGKESNESITEIGNSIPTPEPFYTHETIVSKFVASTTLENPASKSRKDRRSTRSKDEVVPDMSAPVDTVKQSNEAISEIGKCKTTSEPAWTDVTIVSKSDASIDLGKHASKSRTTRKSTRSEDKVLPAISASIETGKESTEAISVTAKSTDVASKFDVSTTLEKPASMSRKDQRSTRSKPGISAPVDTDKESYEAKSGVGKSKTTPESVYTDDTIFPKTDASIDLEKHASKSQMNRRSTRSEGKVLLPEISASIETGKENNEAISEIGKSTITPGPFYTDETIGSKFDASTTLEKPASKSRKDRMSARSKDKVVPDISAPDRTDKESNEDIFEKEKRTITTPLASSSDEAASKDWNDRGSTRSKDKVLPAMSASIGSDKESNEPISKTASIQKSTTPEPAASDEAFAPGKLAARNQRDTRFDRSEERILPALAISIDKEETNEVISDIIGALKTTLTPEPSVDNIEPVSKDETGSSAAMPDKTTKTLRLRPRKISKKEESIIIEQYEMPSSAIENPIDEKVGNEELSSVEAIHGGSDTVLPDLPNIVDTTKFEDLSNDLSSQKVEPLVDGIAEAHAESTMPDQSIIESSKPPMEKHVFIQDSVSLDESQIIGGIEEPIGSEASDTKFDDRKRIVFDLEVIKVKDDVNNKAFIATSVSNSENLPKCASATESVEPIFSVADIPLPDEKPLEKDSLVCTVPKEPEENSLVKESTIVNVPAFGDQSSKEEQVINKIEDKTAVEYSRSRRSRNRTKSSSKLLEKYEYLIGTQQLEDNSHPEEKRNEKDYNIDNLSTWRFQEKHSRSNKDSEVQDEIMGISKRSKKHRRSSRHETATVAPLKLTKVEKSASKGGSSIEYKLESSPEYEKSRKRKLSESSEEKSHRKERHRTRSHRKDKSHAPSSKIEIPTPVDDHKDVSAVSDTKESEKCDVTILESEQSTVDTLRPIEATEKVTPTTGIISDTVYRGKSKIQRHFSRSKSLRNRWDVVSSQEEDKDTSAVEQSKEYTSLVENKYTGDNSQLVIQHIAVSKEKHIEVSREQHFEVSREKHIEVSKDMVQSDTGVSTDLKNDFVQESSSKDALAHEDAEKTNETGNSTDLKNDFLQESSSKEALAHEDAEKTVNFEQSLANVPEAVVLDDERGSKEQYLETVQETPELIGDSTESDKKILEEELQQNLENTDSKSDNLELPLGEKLQTQVEQISENIPSLIKADFGNIVKDVTATSIEDVCHAGAIPDDTVLLDTEHVQLNKGEVTQHIEAQSLSLSTLPETISIDPVKTQYDLNYTNSDIHAEVNQADEAIKSCVDSSLIEKHDEVIEEKPEPSQEEVSLSEKNLAKMQVQGKRPSLEKRVRSPPRKHAKVDDTDSDTKPDVSAEHYDDGILSKKEKSVPPKKSRWSRRSSDTKRDSEEEHDSALKHDILEVVPETSVQEEVIMQDNVIELESSVIERTESSFIDATNVDITATTDTDLILPPKKSKRISDITDSFSGERISPEKKSDTDSLSFPSYDDSFMSTSLRSNIEGLIKEIDSIDSDNMDVSTSSQVKLMNIEVDATKTESLLSTAMISDNSTTKQKEFSEVPKGLPPKKKKIDISMNEMLPSSEPPKNIEKVTDIPQAPKKKMQKLFENSQVFERQEKATEIPLMSPLAKKKSFLFHQGEFDLSQQKLNYKEDKSDTTDDLSQIRNKRKSISTGDQPMKKEKLEEVEVVTSKKDEHKKPVDISVLNLSKKLIPTVGYIKSEQEVKIATEVKFENDYMPTVKSTSKTEDFPVIITPKKELADKEEVVVATHEVIDNKDVSVNAVKITPSEAVIPGTTPNEPELVPIAVTPTVMSEQDLADVQVEITTNKVISEVKPTLGLFSMDYSEPSVVKTDVPQLIKKEVIQAIKKEIIQPFKKDTSKIGGVVGTEFISKASVKEFESRPCKPQPNAYAFKSELLDILEGNSNSSTNSSGSEKKFKTSFDNYDKKTTVQGIIDFEEAIPSQIVLSNKVSPESVLMDSPKLLERLSMSTDVSKENAHTVVSQSDVKKPEGLTTALVNKVKKTGTPRPGQKIVIKTTRMPANTAAKTSTNKPIILSEQIIRPATTGVVKQTVQPQGMKRQYEDIEDIETAFIIPKMTKKVEEEETVESPPPEKKSKSSKSGKAKILQQTIITPKGEIIPQASATSAAIKLEPVQMHPAQEEPVFDINSMPIVLSDDLLTPESIQNMPVVLSEEVLSQPVGKPSEKRLTTVPKKMAANLGTKQILFKTTQQSSTTIAHPKQTTKARILSSVAQGTQSKLQKTTPAILASGTTPDGKPAKYVLVPPPGTTVTTQVKATKQAIIKKQPVSTPKPAPVAASTADVSGQLAGNKIMIVTNAQGQQTRVVLTPQQQKAFMQAQTGKAKAVLKGTIPKALLESATTVAGPSGPPVVTAVPTSQAVSATVSSHGALLMPATKPVKPPGSSKKSGQRSSKPPQKTILIKNQMGQTVRKIQGTDDADLDRQVAEQLEAIKASARLQQSNKPPEIINYTSRSIPNSSASSKSTIRKSYAKKVEMTKGKPPVGTVPVDDQTNQEEASSVPALAPLSPQQRVPLVQNQAAPKQQAMKKVEPYKSSDTVPQLQKQQTTVPSKPEARPSAAPRESESKRAESPLRQVVIQDGLGNLTTVTVGQILAIPSETVDGQPQSYMLVTVDESGNLTPLNNETLMSLDPSLGVGGDIENMMLQMEGQGTSSPAKTTELNAPSLPTSSAAVKKPKISDKKAEERLKPEPVKQAPPPIKEPKLPSAEPTKPQEPPLAVEQQIVIGEGIIPGDAGGQQLILTGDPVTTQKFLDSLQDGSTDLANILANAEGGSVIIQADGQQILIRANPAPAQSALGISENRENSANPMFSGHRPPSQDILAAALANTDMFQGNDPQSSQSTVKGLTGAQLSPGGASLYPMPVGNVLETSLTLSSPIMTPLEVPSTNSKKVNDEASILKEVPKNVDLPITVTDPNIIQTVAHQQAAGLMELSLPISESVASADMSSPSYSYSLPTLDDSVCMNQKGFNNSMPLLTDDVEAESSTASSSDRQNETTPTSFMSGLGQPTLSESIDSSQEEVVKTSTFGDMRSLPMLTDDVTEDSGSSRGSTKPHRSSPKRIERDIIDEGLSTLGGEMCSSLSEPPPDMFDLSSITAKEEEISSDVSSLPEPETLSINSENSGEIPIQPAIVANLNDLKSAGDDQYSSDEKEPRFDS